jgi:hypothetical protein
MSVRVPVDKFESPPSTSLLMSVAADSGDGTGYGSITTTDVYPALPKARAVDVPQAPAPTTRIEDDLVSFGMQVWLLMTAVYINRDLGP